MEEHKGWSPEEWLRVTFSDESKFNMSGSDGIQYCRRRSGEENMERNLKKSIKPGEGSITVWGCITPNGTGRLHRVEGNMDSIQYCNILEKSLLGTLSDQSLQPSDIILQQDNDPKHRSRLAQAWLRDNGLEVLKWASHSPDMNIIEHVWDEMDHRLHARNPFPCNLEELWTALQEEWAAVTIDTIQTLYESMPGRITAYASEKAEGTFSKC